MPVENAAPTTFDAGAEAAHTKSDTAIDAACRRWGATNIEVWSRLEFFAEIAFACLTWDQSFLDRNRRAWSPMGQERSLTLKLSEPLLACG